MAEIIHAFGAAEPAKHQKEVIDLLETVLADVRTGRIKGVAIVTVVNDGSITTCWHRGSESHFTLVGAAQWLIHRLLTEGSND